MTDTLYDILLDLVHELGFYYSGEATSDGTGTTMVDTFIPGDDDDWNNGTIFIESGDWESRYARITNYVSSSGTITFETLTGDGGEATSEGDYFTICEPKFPIGTLKQAVNRELQKIEIPKVDTSSITISDEQTEYSLPSACHDLRQVYLQQEDDDADDNRWIPINWTVEISDTGSADTLILERQYPADYALKLVYVASHAKLSSYGSNLNEIVSIEHIVYGAAANVLRQRARYYNDGDDYIREDIERYEQKQREYNFNNPIRLPAIHGNSMRYAARRREDKIGDI